MVDGTTYERWRRPIGRRKYGRWYTGSGSRESGKEVVLVV